tara:strand:- start:10395 stop:10730 length:336 start_codon:yes stop_codon:yes gene_type:complete
MPTIDLDLIYKVNVMDTSATAPVDPATPNPRINISINFRSKNISMGNYTLAELRLLTGDTPTYRDVETSTTTPNIGNTDMPEFTDTIDSADFITWAKKFPNSGLQMFFSQM